MSDILNTILARKAQEVVALKARSSLAEQRARAADVAAPRGFAAALRAKLAKGVRDRKSVV